MHPLQLLDHLRRRPFIPFRLQLADGSTRDVYHPSDLLLGAEEVTYHPWGRTEVIRAENITAVVPVPAPGAPP